MISDGGTIQCSGKFHKVKIMMGDYTLESMMFAIPMGGADIVLGVQWHTTLGTIQINF